MIICEITPLNKKKSTDESISNVCYVHQQLFELLHSNILRNENDENRLLLYK